MGNNIFAARNILERYERKMKVVSRKVNKNKLTTLRSIVFQLSWISSHLVLFSAVLSSDVDSKEYEQSEQTKQTNRNPACKNKVDFLKPKIPNQGSTLRPIQSHLRLNFTYLRLEKRE